MELILLHDDKAENPIMLEGATGKIEELAAKIVAVTREQGEKIINLKKTEKEKSK